MCLHASISYKGRQQLRALGNDFLKWKYCWDVLGCYGIYTVFQKLSGSHKALVEMQDDVSELLRSATREYKQTKVCLQPHNSYPEMWHLQQSKCHISG